MYKTANVLLLLYQVRKGLIGNIKFSDVLGLGPFLWSERVSDVLGFGLFCVRGLCSVYFLQFVNKILSTRIQKIPNHP